MKRTRKVSESTATGPTFFTAADACAAMIAAPATEWRALVEGPCKPWLQEIIRHCEVRAEKAARLAEYCEARHGSGCGDQGHAQGVKEANMVTTKLRRAFGYNNAKAGQFTF